jgi:pantoate--beta-alanine ligase
VVCPTVREKNGLAISSRNRYLTAQEKKDAASIYKSLRKCEQMVKQGIRETEPIIAQMRKILSPVSSIEYISIVDAQTLQNLDKIAGTAIAAVAVKIGSTRLIDNILIDVLAG